MTRIKVVAGYLGVFLTVLAVATGAFTILFAHPNAQWSNEASKLLDSVAQQVMSNGVTSDLNEHLASGSRLQDWLASVVFLQMEADENHPTGQAVAASDPRLIGLSADEVFDRLSARADKERGMQGMHKSVTASDGTRNWVATYGSPQHVNGYAWLVGTVPYFSLIGAWLAITAWVIMDVRELQKTNVVAWALLSLVTGPVALGVWLISRPGSDKSKPDFCPSCGSTVAADTAYCVQCGHPIQALCPKCGRRVDLGWAYCGSCGMPLRDE